MPIWQLLGLQYKSIISAQCKRGTIRFGKADRIATANALVRSYIYRVETDIG